MNKSELIARVSARLGDQKASSTAVDVMVSEIENAVSAGDRVNISGFGVFEKRDRAARVSRNPRTGELIQVQQTSVPVFRPGQTFKSLVSGERKPARPSASSAGRAQPAKATARKTQTAKAPQSKTSQSKAPQSKAPQSKAPQSKAQAGRAQSSRGQSSRAQASSYARSSYAGGRSQSSYARPGATAKRQPARTRAR
jgi:DNA-binding protein HU-beta